MHVKRDLSVIHFLSAWLLEESCQHRSALCKALGRTGKWRLVSVLNHFFCISRILTLRGGV